LQGGLTVTSIDWLGDVIVAPLLAGFALRHPHVRVKLLNDERNFNVAARDAYLSISFRALAQENLVQRRICSVAYGAYALAERSEQAGTAHAALVMIERSDGSYLLDDWRAAALPHARVALSVNSMNSVLAAVLGGEVIGILPHPLASRYPQLTRLVCEVADPQLDLRLGFHQDMRETAKMRALVDYMALELPRQCVAGGAREAERAQ
jgi:DNA-binding transcriptional LysR family regulator